MVSIDVALLHGFLAAASLNWVSYMISIREVPRTRIVRRAWLAYSPGIIIPIWTQTSDMLAIILMMTSVIAALAATVCLTRPNLTTIAALSIQAAPLLAHSILACVIAFKHGALIAKIAALAPPILTVLVTISA
jgi:hypothetical protein